MGMVSGVKCHPGPASGLTTCYRYPLKWALWASQILKHANFLLKTMPKSARLLLNMGMVSGVKVPPRAIKWARNLSQVSTEVAGASGPMGCAAFSSMTKFVLQTMLKSAFLLLNMGMLCGVKCLPGSASKLKICLHNPLR